jgi:ADP-ribose pyrophosphatase YjhB (NUDIX family)
MDSKNAFGLVVKAIIVDAENRCLLIRRSAACRHYVGCWEWPGGKADPGEDFATAGVREVREETGLEVELTGFAGATSFEMAEVHVVVLCLEARPLGTTVRLSEEHDASAWVPLGEFARYQLTPGTKDFMLDYAKRKGATP